MGSIRASDERRNPTSPQFPRMMHLTSQFYNVNESADYMTGFPQKRKCEWGEGGTTSSSDSQDDGDVNIGSADELEDDDSEYVEFMTRRNTRDFSSLEIWLSLQDPNKPCNGCRKYGRHCKRLARGPRCDYCSNVRCYCSFTDEYYRWQFTIHHQWMTPSSFDKMLARFHRERLDKRATRAREKYATVVSKDGRASTGIRKGHEPQRKQLFCNDPTGPTKTVDGNFPVGHGQLIKEHRDSYKDEVTMLRERICMLEQKLEQDQSNVAESIRKATAEAMDVFMASMMSNMKDKFRAS